MNWQKVLAGAVTGFLAAAVVDIDAWKKSKQSADHAWYDAGSIGNAPVVAFEWRTAWPRWIIGALIGAAGGAGMSV